MQDHSRYLEQFAQMISFRGLTDNTLKSYTSYLKSYLSYLDDHLRKKPEDVSWEEMRAYIQFIQKDRNLSGRTINGHIAQLRFLTTYVLHKPWDPYQLPTRKFDTYMPFVPTQEEVGHFIDTLQNPKQKAMIAIMYSAGLRVCEVCRLRYEDISRKNMSIHVTRSKNRSDRYAILSKRALLILSDYWKTCGKPMGWLFPGAHEGRHVVTFTVSRYISEHEKRIGWERRLTCHSFRHAFGTHLYENGADLANIQALLGHKSLSSTLIYVRLGKIGAKSAASPFDSMGGDSDEQV